MNEHDNTLTKQRFNNFTEDLSSETSYALWQAINSMAGFELQKKHLKDNTLILPVEYGPGYTLDLILSNVSGVPANYEHIEFDANSFCKKGNIYEVSGLAGFADEPFVMSFTNPESKVKCFNATSEGFSASPWNTLLYISMEIVAKSHIPGDYLNQKEQELLPFLKELIRLNSLLSLCVERDTNEFPLLKEFFKKYNCKKVLDLVEKAENHPVDTKKYERITFRLLNLLNTLEYEPLWREIYGKISDSQAEYPKQYSAPENIRSKIQNLMEDHGFTGTYPHFTKTGKINGVRMAQSYGVSYFVFNEKNTVFFVDCQEQKFGETTIIQFISGTACLKKAETAKDIYSCTFNAKGRRIFDTIQYDINSDNLETIVNIAVKRTQLKKLSKEEKASINKPSALLTFIIAFLFFGGLFAIGFTLLFPLLMMLFIALLDGWTMALEMFSGFPWREVFWGCWILSGCATGIITTLVKRK